MKKTKELGNLCGWSSWRCALHLKDERLQDECGYCHLRVQECTQDKTRREEDTILFQFTHQFGRGSLLTKSILIVSKT